MLGGRGKDETEVRMLQDTKVLERLGHSWGERDTCGTPGGSSQTPAFSSPLNISSEANQMSSQALPAGYLTKGSSGGGGGQPRYQGQKKKLLCSPEAMSAERDPNTSRYQPFPYIAMFDLHSNLQP